MRLPSSRPMLMRCLTHTLRFAPFPAALACGTGSVYPMGWSLRASRSVVWQSNWRRPRLFSEPFAQSGAPQRPDFWQSAAAGCLIQCHRSQWKACAARGGRCRGGSPVFRAACCLRWTTPALSSATKILVYLPAPRGPMPMQRVPAMMVVRQHRGSSRSSPSGSRWTLWPQPPVSCALCPPLMSPRHRMSCAWRMARASGCCRPRSAPSSLAYHSWMRLLTHWRQRSVVLMWSAMWVHRVCAKASHSWRFQGYLASMSGCVTRSTSTRSSASLPPLRCRMCFRSSIANRQKPCPAAE
mmetsp:Transcript_12657/g.40434  ORF Transcript_12657/g.40434 Transcript_12657/m.40434 type:complete len:297 (-) Transcript_12657:230-1120(-)